MSKLKYVSKKGVCAIRRVVAIIFDLWLLGKEKREREREVSAFSKKKKS